MPFSDFNNPDFTYFLWQKIKGSENQKLCCQLRALNKHYASYFQEEIICADVKYDKLKGLATSNIAQQILNLKLSVPVESQIVDDLCFISTKYFANISSIKLRFENPKQNKYRFERKRERGLERRLVMELKHDLTIRGLSIAKKNQNINKLKLKLEIWGKNKYNLNIFNSKFDGVQLHADVIPLVEISGVKFMNSPLSGFYARVCTSVAVKNIFAKNCGYGLYIFGCQNFVASNINVKQCQKIGFGIRQLENFQITNIKIFNCGQGLEFDSGLSIDNSNGKMTDVVVGECSRQGVHIYNAQVRYERFQGINKNAGNNVVIKSELSSFVEGV